MTYGLGLGWTHSNKLFLGADFTLQKWGSVEFPGTVQQGAQKVYALRKDLLKDRYAVNIGADYVPNPSPTSRSFLGRVHYRLGLGFATPYYYINGAQWARSSAKDLITENTFRINLGLTFNERWFAKWKVD